jgi:energy-coupling factor transporter transmembrane protein EcfT
LFGYIHYRVYLFFKEKGDNVPEFKGTLILSLIQCFTIIDVMVIIKTIRDYSFPSIVTFLPLLIVTGFVNWFLYERNFDAEKIERRWKHESPAQRIRNGWLIGVYIFVSFLVPVVYGYLKMNLQVI